MLTVNFFPEQNCPVPNSFLNLERVVKTATILCLDFSSAQEHFPIIILHFKMPFFDIQQAVPTVQPGGLTSSILQKNIIYT